MKLEKQQKKGFILSALAFSMLLVHVPAHALEALADSDLRNVNGQDGVHIETTMAEANIKTLYWTDQVGRAESDATSQALTAIADTVKLTKSNTSSDPLKFDLKLNTGSVGSKAGLGLDLSLSKMLMSVDNFRVCDSDTSNTRCSAPLGSVAVQTTSDTSINFKTKNGLFSKDDQIQMDLGVKNANIYLGQTAASGQLNQLILKNFNFNFGGFAFAFVDATEGLKLQTNKVGAAAAGNLTTPSLTNGYVDLTRVEDSALANANTGSYASNGKTTNSGLNIEILVNKNVNKLAPYALDTATNSPVGANGLIRVGASGRMVNGSLQIRGVQNAGTLIGKAVTSTGTVTANDIGGTSGIGFRMQTEFTKDGDTMLSNALGKSGEATTLEIGGAGLKSYGFEFGNLTGLQKDARATFSTGDVYINLTDSKQLNLPVNTVFQSSAFGNGSKLTTATDYNQIIYDTYNTAANNRPYSLVAALRGAEFQAISRRGRFTASAGITDENYLFKKDDGMSNNWGLALPFYNLNANMAMFGVNADAASSYYFDALGKKTQVATSGTTPRLGFSLGMTTEGRNTDGSKTTSIMVVDGVNDYYLGLRNIDMLLKGYGTMGLENGSVNLSLKDMLVVMSAQLAAGWLPSAAKNNLTNFSKNDDVLMGLKMRFGGNMNLSLIPNSEIKADGTGNSMIIVGDLALTGTNNTIQISDSGSAGESSLGLDNLSGNLAFNNAIVINKTENTPDGKGQVGFNTTLTLNPSQTAEGVFRARDLNFYAPGATSGSRLGEIALTGGRLTSQLNIIPRN